MAVTRAHAAPPANAAEIMLEAELRGRIDGEVRFDRTSRMLYSTDASNYQIEPVGVVIPRHVDDVHAAVELAAKHGISILPRGGGSALAGQTVGHSLVIDFSKYMAEVLELNVEERTVRVQPGINLDLLNTTLKKHGLMFGPDPSSGNRATIGGVIGNNSSGAHSILYGMTSDHVLQTVVVLPDGDRVTLEPGAVARAGQDDPLGRLMSKLLAFQETHSPIIARDFPRHWRRATGYSLDQFLKPELNPARLVVSSEGTLATTVEAMLGLVPTPRKTALALLQFDDLVESMATTTTILEANPSAIELMDRMLIELTRAQPGFASQISYIKGNPEAVLAVEFYGETDEELRDQLDKLEWRLREASMLPREEMIRVTDTKQQSDVWTVRKAGLGLLMSIRGDAKPIPGIEDVSVPVEHLAEYVAEIKQLCADYGTVAAYYAHASAGCLHIRPLINLKEADGVRAMDEITRAAADMAHRFSGVMSGEHGDGLQRSELNEKIFGPDLYRAMREFKAIFDPQGIMNPGKVVDAPPMVESLRFGADYRTAPIVTHLDFSREGSFAQAIEMCNGAGVCRKVGAGTMCPSYMATRDERDTTRARANALRNALAGRMFSPEEMTSREVYDVLDLCLSCKACKTECPSSVDMAKIKTEFLAQYHDKHGVDARTRMFGAVHQSAKLASRFPGIANRAMESPAGRAALVKMGVHPERRMSRFADETFEAWWAGHVRRRDAQTTPRETRGKVVYFHDTFATYNYPRVGRAVVRLLEAAGFEVVVETRRACCGRPMYSKGLVSDAREVAKANVEALAPYVRQGIPVVGSEPSCVLMFRDEYLDLLPGDEDARQLGANSFMIDEFLQRLNAKGELGIQWRSEQRDVLFHGHCHQKAVVGMGPSMAVLRRAGINATESGAGCCGMAGSFGYETEHYDVSRRVGEERLFPRVRQTPESTTIAVAGVSCRQQIEHFTDRRVKHIAEVLAEQVAPGHVWSPESQATAAD